jgi:MHS family proline/betaine transporter-like MFS transporter
MDAAVAAWALRVVRARPARLSCGVAAGGGSAPIGALTMSVAMESRGNLWKIIGASSVGTLIEWYDFYIFGSLAAIIATQFFPRDNPTAAFLSTLATFAAGFIVRPFGAIVFGRLGDVIGRKYTFLVTLMLMGGATFAIGLVPGYDQIGYFAPVIVLVLRLLQGLALGGEYGGAATYVAEHAPDGQRGFWTSWIQTTATLGLFVSLGVILVCRSSMDAQAFNSWGWRIPFLLSIFLVVFSYFLRLRMKESPVFSRMKATGKTSKNPIKESFGNWFNLKFVLLALFGATAGQGVVWYTGQFYVLSFMQKSLHVEFSQTNIIIGIALAIGTPFFVVMGSLSDKIGRKPIMMVGCLLAVIFYLPIFHGIAAQADLGSKTPAGEAVLVGEPVASTAAADDAKLGVKKGDAITTTKHTVRYEDGTTAVRTTVSVGEAGGAASVSYADVRLGGGPFIVCVGLIAVLVTFVTMVYGPIAAFLVELFPTKIRYTSMSLPYHVGNGVFGGLVPFIATWLASSQLAHEGGTLSKIAGGPMFVGLLYPIAIAAITFVVGTLLIRDTRHVSMHEDLTLVGEEAGSEHEPASGGTPEKGAGGPAKG